MSPISFISIGCRRARKYVSVLLAFCSGVRCRWARSGVWHFFIAKYSARRSTADGASNTRRGSCIAGYTRVKALRFTGRLAKPCSRVNYVRHPSVVSCHPRLRPGKLTLLTYIHLALFTTFVVGVGMVAGVLWAIFWFVSVGGLPTGGPLFATGFVGWSPIVSTGFVFSLGCAPGSRIVATISAYVSFAGGALTSAHVFLGGSVGSLAGGAIIYSIWFHLV
jgi:hypothetical protein